jgi:hypothetical protein
MPGLKPRYSQLRSCKYRRGRAARLWRPAPALLRQLYRQRGLWRETAPNAAAPPIWSFGRPFIANSDLVERMKQGVPLAQIDPSTLCGGCEKGQADYPLASTAAVAG